MAKIYATKTPFIPKSSPKKETIHFLLSYSKAMRVFKIGKHTFEYLSN